MCGFTLLLSQGPSPLISEPQRVALKARGPDSFQIVHRQYTVSVAGGPLCPPRPSLSLSLAASVLSLRGMKVQSQPLIDHGSGSLFTWNGEAWLSGSKEVQGNDAHFVFRRILARANFSQDALPREERLVLVLRDVLGAITGPFSFLFFDTRSSCLFYGRDFLGRKSLLHRRSERGTLEVSSLPMEGDPGGWTEVDPCGIHYLKFSAPFPPSGRLCPWKSKEQV